MDYTPYMNLITSEHRNSPRFTAWVHFLISLFDVDVERELTSLFNVQSSVGNQLDIIGELVGIPRAFPPLADMPGYPPVLPDETYRRLIQAKIVRNQFKGQQGTLQNLWESVFEADIQALVTDNQDMTMDVELIGDYSPLDIALVLHGHIIPKPLGVGVKVNMASDVEAEMLYAGASVSNAAKIGILFFYYDPNPTSFDVFIGAILSSAYGKTDIYMLYPDPNPTSTEVLAGSAFGCAHGMTKIDFRYVDPDMVQTSIGVGMSPMVINGMISIKNHDPSELTVLTATSHGSSMSTNTATITILTTDRPGMLDTTS